MKTQIKCLWRAGFWCLLLAGSLSALDHYCPPGDLNDDCNVDLEDFSILAAYWLEGPIACPAGTANCDANDINGCETDIYTDETNCGGCGVVCDLPHALEACDAGVCIIDDCDTGWDDCDSQSANGCETNILGDVNNCGGCGNICDLAHALEGCQNGQCIVVTCNAGWANCDGNHANGCEWEFAAANTCGTAQYIGSVDGDENSCRSGPSQSNHRGYWYRIYVNESQSGIFPIYDLHLWVRLTIPTGIDYDLYLYSSCGSLVDSSTQSGNQTEQVDFCWNDTTSNDSRDMWIEVRYFNGSSCTNWSLQTWGGCPTGP